MISSLFGGNTTANDEKADDTTPNEEQEQVTSRKDEEETEDATDKSDVKSSDSAGGEHAPSASAAPDAKSNSEPTDIDLLNGDYESVSSTEEENGPDSSKESPVNIPPPAAFQHNHPPSSNSSKSSNDDGYDGDGDGNGDGDGDVDGDSDGDDDDDGNGDDNHKKSKEDADSSESKVEEAGVRKHETPLDLFNDFFKKDDLHSKGSSSSSSSPSLDEVDNNKELKRPRQHQPALDLFENQASHENHGKLEPLIFDDDDLPRNINIVVSDVEAGDESSVDDEMGRLINDAKDFESSDVKGMQVLDSLLPDCFEIVDLVKFFLMTYCRSRILWVALGILALMALTSSSSSQSNSSSIMANDGNPFDPVLQGIREHGRAISDDDIVIAHDDDALFWERADASNEKVDTLMEVMADHLKVNVMRNVTGGQLVHFAKVTSPVRKRDIPVFWHIPRSGGEMMKDILGRCYKLVQASERGMIEGHYSYNKDFLEVMQVNDGSYYINVDTTTITGLKRAKYLDFESSGIADVIVTPHLHPINDILLTKDFRGRLFTMFRHPIDRAISIYNDLENADWVEPELKGLSIEAFAYSRFAPDNDIMRMLLKKPVGELVNDDYEIAKQILQERCIVGIMKKINSSLKKFETFFGWEIDEQGKECRDQILKTAKKEVNDHNVDEGSVAWNAFWIKNKYDVRLYEYATNLFREQGIFNPY